MSEVKKVMLNIFLILGVGIISTVVSAESIAYQDTRDACLSNITGIQTIEGAYTDATGTKSINSPDGSTRGINGFASISTPNCVVDVMAIIFYITNDYPGGEYTIATSPYKSAFNSNYLTTSVNYKAPKITYDETVDPASPNYGKNSNYPHCLHVYRWAENNGIKALGGWHRNTTKYTTRCKW